jgi:putative acetyltransferase
MSGMELAIRVDDPRAEDVRELLAIHLGFSRGVTPAEYSFALDEDQLVDPGITFFSARRAGQLVGIAALRRLDETHGELKSMHTRAAERGRGVGRALVLHILDVARAAGYRRVSLETGATEDFLAARTLYARVGFQPCPAFADYQPSPYNTFMTISLEPAGGDTSGSRLQSRWPPQSA